MYQNLLLKRHRKWILPNADRHAVRRHHFFNHLRLGQAMAKLKAFF